MYSRERKGVLIARRGGVAEDDRSFLVQSETKPGHEYRVYFTNRPSCGCEDYERHGGGYCKHIWAVHYAVIAESGTGGSDRRARIRVFRSCRSCSLASCQKPSRTQPSETATAKTTKKSVPRRTKGAILEERQLFAQLGRVDGGNA